jgi:hypothetical protein
MVAKASSPPGSDLVDREGMIDPVRERKLVRKLDYAIIPPVMLLYCFSFLDRVNIGNARYDSHHSTLLCSRELTTALDFTVWKMT